MVRTHAAWLLVTAAGSAAGEWSVREEVRGPRFDASEATFVYDHWHGMVYAVGGYANAYDEATPYIQTFRDGEWLGAIALPIGVATTHHGYHLDERLLYLVGGQVGAACSLPTTRVVAWLAQTDLFEEFPDLPEPRYTPFVGVLENVLYVVGGEDWTRTTSADGGWRLEEGRGWREIAKIPVSSGIHGLGWVYDGMLYVFAGCFSDMPSSPGATMDECNAKAYHVHGMRQHHVPIGAVQRYHPTTDSWEDLEADPFPSCQHTTVAYGEKLLFIGGATRGTLTYAPYHDSVAMNIEAGAAVRAWDFATSTWSLLPPLPIATRLAMAWISNDTLSVTRPTEAHDPGTPRTATRDVAWLSDLQAFVRADKLRLLRCLRRREKQIVFRFPDDEGYSRVRLVHNRQASDEKFPALVVLASNEAEVAAAVACATEADLTVCARGGRHSMEGDSSCAGGMVVDVRRLNNVTVIENNNNTTLVELGAGHTVGQMALNLSRLGLMIPSGRCASVGLAGIALSGGQGALTRLYGLTADAIVAVRYVSANGTLQTASDKENREMLWLARGGGSGDSYPGVVASLTLRAVPIAPTMSTVTITFSRVPSVDQAVELFEAWQRFAPDHPDRRLSLEYRLHSAAKTVGYKRCAVSGSFVGAVAELKHLIEEQFYQLLSESAREQLTSAYIEHATYVDFVSADAGTTDLASGESGTNAAGDAYVRWKSRSTVAFDNVNGDFVRRILDFYWNEHMLPTKAYVEFKALGGAMSDIDPSSTAFHHRRARWWLLSNVQWKSDVAAKERLEHCKSHYQLFRALRIFTGPAQYGGYGDHSAADTSWAERDAYYGGNSRAILNISLTRDPYGRFRRMEAIRHPRTGSGACRDVFV